jgi:hypothetical protein
MSTREQIINKITSMPKGSVFTLSDLSEVADYKAINLTVARLEKEGLVRRILRGVYDYPKLNETSGEPIDTNPDDVAKAIARNFVWNIIPSGERCLYILKLTDKQVTDYSYLSDGPSKEYEYDGIKITYKQIAKREISKIAYKTAIIVHALKTLGKEADFSKPIQHLASTLNKQEKEFLLQDAKYVTDWVYEIIKEICNTK